MLCLCKCFHNVCNVAYITYIMDIITEAKKERRKAERKWRETRLVMHKGIYQAARDNVTVLLSKSKEEYYKDKISASDDTQSTMFACVKELLNLKKPSKLPESDCTQELADRIADYLKIRLKN